MTSIPSSHNGLPDGCHLQFIGEMVPKAVLVETSQEQDLCLSMKLFREVMADLRSKKVQVLQVRGKTLAISELGGDGSHLEVFFDGKPMEVQYSAAGLVDHTLIFRGDQIVVDLGDDAVEGDSERVLYPPVDMMKSMSMKSPLRGE